MANTCLQQRAQTFSKQTSASTDPFKCEVRVRKKTQLCSQTAIDLVTSVSVLAERQAQCYWFEQGTSALVFHYKEQYCLFFMLMLALITVISFLFPMFLHPSEKHFVWRPHKACPKETHRKSEFHLCIFHICVWFCKGTQMEIQLNRITNCGSIVRVPWIFSDQFAQQTHHTCSLPC